MEELYNKMGEYVKMEEELPFDEFQSYYNSVMNFLQKEYQNLSVDELIKVKGIVRIMCANARTRSLVKDVNRKKFVKIGEKTAFWDDAINRHLVKDEGMDADEVQKKVDALW